MIRLEHRDGEEVGAVGPGVEMRERVNRLGSLAVDRAVRLDAEGARIGALGHPGVGDPVIDHQEEREVGNRLGLRLDRQICGSGHAG